MAPDDYAYNTDGVMAVWTRIIDHKYSRYQSSEWAYPFLSCTDTKEWFLKSQVARSQLITIAVKDG